MMDDCTVVCYLKSEQDTKLPHFPEDVPWNSKKWRVLLYFNSRKTLCFAGRQYPFSSNKGMDWIIHKCFNNLFIDDYEGGFARNRRWAKWTDYMINSAFDKKNSIKMEFISYVPFKDGLVELKELVQNVQGSKQFNDVLTSSIYKPIYTYLEREGLWSSSFEPVPTKFTKITVGHPTYCLRCGRNEAMDEGGTMMCYDCEFEFGNSNNDAFCTCDCCGDRTLTDDTRISSDDKVYCPQCWEDYVETCACCGDQLETDKMKYDDELEQWYCKDCWFDRN